MIHNEKEVQAMSDESAAIVGPAGLQQITGIPANTWIDWDKKNTGPQGFPRSFRIGRRRVWNREAVLAWLKKQEEGAPLK